VTILDLNPLTTLIDGYRAALLGDPVPSAARFMYVAVLSAALIAGGLLVFRRQAPAFVDNL
jgi:ABC-type polysaccharide/polyol phosphate export permease